jgi:hypothetical protein
MGGGSGRLQLVVLVGQHRGGSCGHLGLVLANQVGVDGDLGGAQRGSLHERQVALARQLARQPQEGLLKVVVGLGRNVVVLQILLAVKRNVLGLDAAILKDKNEQKKETKQL